MGESGNIVINGLDFYGTGDTLTCELWHRVGSALDYPWNTDGGGWALTASSTVSREGGTDALTNRRRFPEADFTPIVAARGSVIGMLLQCVEDRVRYSYYQGGNDEGIISEDDNIKVLFGYGVTRFPLQAMVQFDRVFNGVIYYDDPT